MDHGTHTAKTGDAGGKGKGREAHRDIFFVSEGGFRTMYALMR